MFLFLITFASTLMAQCSASNGTESSFSNADGSFKTANQVDGNFNHSDPASVYPSTIAVPSSVTGTVGCIQVEIDGLTGVTSPDNGNGLSLYNLELILVAPDGKYLMVYGGVGQQAAISNLNMTIGDGYTVLGNNGTGNNFTTSSCGSGPTCVNLGPQSYLLSGNYLLVPNQGGAPQAFSSTNGTLPTTDGTATMASVFNNGAAAGAWKLYMADFYGDLVSVTGWKLHIWTKAVAASATAITSNTNPAASGSSVTLTSTTTSGTPAVPVPGGTVDFYYLNSTSGTSSTIAGCTGLTVNSSGQATCSKTLSLATGSTCTTVTSGGSSASQTLPAYPTVCAGNQTIYAVYSGDSGASIAGSTSGDLTLVVPSTQTHSGDQWCSTSPVVLLNNGTSITYPSYINVSGYAAGTTVSTVSVSLSGLQGSQGITGQYLLVAPNGKNLDFMDDAFAGEAQGPVNLTIEDDAGQIPGATASSGNYEPYDNNSLSNDSFPSPPSLPAGADIPGIPGTINHAAPTGSSSNTFAKSFNGATANGAWALYPTSANSQGTQIASGGWCLNLTPNTGVSSTTAVTSSQNPATTGQSVTYTAAVTSGGAPVTSGGTVTFLDNNNTPGGTVSGNNVVSLSASGQAAFASSSLFDAIDLRTSTADVYEGDHTITANYSGSSNDNPSLGSVVERIDDKTTITSPSANNFQACNTGPVYSSQGNKGPFTPNPSNIFVANIPGTISAVTLTLENFFTSTADVINNVESMVEGPNKVGLDFFSGTGGSTNNALTEGNYTFADSAGSVVPNSSFGPGTYKPTSDLANDTFTSSISGLYNVPSTIRYSQPEGSSTFSSTFGNTNPNGAWSLFFDMNAAQNATGAANGWCLNFTENPPTIAASVAHQGIGVSNDFVQGETGAELNVTITNTGNGPTGDPIGSNPLTVTDTIPSGLTYSSFSGTGWSCAASGQTVTCKNDNAVAQGNTYPVLTLNVNVASNAPSSVMNAVSASGAGAALANGSDTVHIDSAPVLFLVKSHSGTFTQGSTAQWAIQISDEAANGATNGTITITDTLPAGYTLRSYTSPGNLWACTGTGTSSVNCAGAPGLPAGAEPGSTITLTVNVPANSPLSVTNTAQAWGGGDLVHTSPATAVTATDTASVAQVPANISISSGNNQTAAINTSFSAPLVVTVTDAGGNPVPGQSVTFTVNTGAGGQGGVFFTGTTATGTTNNAGQVSESITANSSVGSYTVTAQAGTGGPSTSFTLTNLVGFPASIAVASGNGQSATIDTAFANPLIVTVTDSGRNPVPGATVTFSAPGGLTPTLEFSNSTTSISAVTNAAGQASSGSITANLIPGGPYNIQAVVNGFSANFQLTNLHESLTTVASLTTSSATIDVFGFGFPAPGGTLAFTQAGSSNSIAAPVTLNTANAQTSLTSMVSHSTGVNSEPVWTTLADVNGDGILDLITSLYRTDSVSVQLGNGNGTFQAATSVFISGGFGPAEAHLISLRKNGVLDLIVGSFNTNEIAVLPGNGNGTFESPLFFTVGNAPSSLTMGDFNHDGYPDVAVVNTGDNTVSILLNNGSGTLNLPGTPIAVGREPEAIRAGDFTGSGYSDLVVANYEDGTVTTMLNNQNGQFTKSTVSVGSGAHSGPQALAITGTGNSLQLAVANYNDNTVSVMSSNGSGGFGAQTIIAVGKGPDDVNFADFNGDSIPDLVVTNYTSDNVDLLVGKSGGGYTVYGPFAVGTAPYSSAVGDLNLDGTPDIVTSNCYSNSTGTLLTGTQIATPYTGLSLTIGSSVQAAYTPSGGSYGGSSSATTTVP